MGHVAPLGLWIFFYAVCYKHVAPLGLNEAMRLLLLSHQIFYPENPSKVEILIQTIIMSTLNYLYTFDAESTPQIPLIRGTLANVDLFVSFTIDCECKTQTK